MPRIEDSLDMWRSCAHHPNRHSCDHPPKPNSHMCISARTNRLKCEIFVKANQKHAFDFPYVKLVTMYCTVIRLGNGKIVHPRSSPFC